MKRRFLAILTALFCLSLLVLSISAASASATLTGPSVVRAGDTITLSFKMNGSSVLGASGTISYDSSQLTLSSTKQTIKSPWKVEFNGNNFVAYDDSLEKPIKSNTELFTVTFKVKANLATGTKVQVSVTGVTASDGSADANVGTVTYSTQIAAPLSTDNNLTSLTVSNATISPSFSSSVTKYTAEVPFSVSKLDITAKGADKSTVSIDNPNLKANATTTVTITVKAEDGSKKTYTIAVKRAQDPNYVPSDNNDLSGITVNGFILSPVFRADVTEYLVWLPYETSSVTVSGIAADSKASVRVEGGSSLTAGADNPVKVICVAENGEEKVYTVIAKRAPAHGDNGGSDTDTDTDTSIPEDTEPDDTTPDSTVTEPDVTTPEETGTVTDSDTNAPAAPNEPGQKAGGVDLWILIVACIVCLAVGAVGGWFVSKKTKK